MDYKGHKDASTSSLLLNAEKDDHDTLGVLSMENLRVFGESSRNSSISSSRDKINERLKLERAKAMETLQKASHFKRPTQPSVANKENELSINRTPVLDRTDYVPYRCQKSINITDLESEKTIHLESTDILSSVTKNPTHKISFEPSEMTARSTGFPRDLRKEKDNRNRMLSVEEILASSCSADVRSLGDSLRESYGGSNGMSLPRTADMSKTTVDSLNSRDADPAGYSFSNAMRADESCFSSENFAPAELMHSKLMNDELMWAQEYAAIPAAALSDSHAKNESICRRSRVHGDTMLTSMMSNGVTDPDFSIGNYFGKQSENIWNIVHTKSPVKGRAPVALVDSTVVESDSGNISITPKVDNKTYSTHPVNANRTSIEKKHESKDSGNASDNSYLLSVSAIERALVDIHTEDSDGSVVNRLLLAKKTKSCMNPYRDQLLVDKEKPKSQSMSLGGAIERVATANSHETHETNLENKENYDPEALRTMKYSDTLSFSDSLLNSTEMRKFDRSSLGPRSPLSPIEISNPMITVTDEAADFGDLDEHPSMLERDTSRKVRRLKTTRDISPASTISTLEVSHPEHDRKQKRSHSATRDGIEKTPSREQHQDEPSQRKSLTSTRNEQEAISSPNVSKPSPLLRKATGRSPSPAFFDSPISSPRSCLSSHVSSPTWMGHSPQLDSTTNSDRRYLAGGALSSPDCGKFSLPSYGLVTKTASTVSLKGRSTSRCSNSSEFSHRDGKVVPLKVTCLQLSWGSIRLRTNVQKSMQIKNTSTKRLVVKVDVSGPGFQIVNTKGNLITLQSQECRSVSLSFCPTVIGTAVGVLSFSAPNSPSSQTYLDVPLYGYGGTASLIPQNILKGPIGAPFLTMGELKELSGPIARSFTIYNKGPLHGFAVIIIDSVGLDMPRLCDCIEVTPNKVLIPPEGTVKIRVTFKPRRDDIKKIIKKISNVLTLANMRIVCGDEPSRQRIRKLIRTMNEVDKSKFSSKSLDKVWASFPNEKTVNDLDTLKEKSEVTLDLISSLRIHEIALTLNHSILDETADSSLVFPDADETVVFRTFCTSPSQMLDPVDEEEATQSCSSETWSVQPNTLQFESRMRFKVKNDFKQRKFFEVSCNYKHLFRFKPADGYVNAGEEVEVQVSNQQEKPGILPNEQIEIWVYIQNDRISIPVNVDKSYFPWNCR